MCEPTPKPSKTTSISARSRPAPHGWPDCLPLRCASRPARCVRGNATMLQRLLGNLLDNAARHGAPPILLSLAIDRAAQQAVLIVEDHGPGIVDPKRMLQPFERGDASRAQGGAGLGLAIVARIVERHAGTLEIGAVDGGGTRVTVRLPLADPARAIERRFD